jgi:phosphoglycolate phosphatase
MTASSQHFRLVLFDIDGTLLTTNGVAHRAFVEAFETHLARAGALHTHDFAGKTDLRIFRELARLAGVPDTDADRARDTVLDTFFSLLDQRLSADSITVLPGVRALLDALDGIEAATPALLTGNTRRGARIKLTPPDLLRHFSFGAFGDDAEDRRDLPEIAVSRAYDRTGATFRGKDIVVIGDTPHDVTCGRHLNVRSIAVATGRHSTAELAQASPDHLFTTLEDTDAILDAILD